VTPKISGIPIGLPTDMPKAWFVALASLSKAATPRRLKENAARPMPVILPRDRRKGRMSEPSRLIVGRSTGWRAIWKCGSISPVTMSRPRA
jgi:hypothetical protein